MRSVITICIGKGEIIPQWFRLPAVEVYRSPRSLQSAAVCRYPLPHPPHSRLVQTGSGYHPSPTEDIYSPYFSRCCLYVFASLALVLSLAEHKFLTHFADSNPEIFARPSAKKYHPLKMYVPISTAVTVSCSTLV